MSLDFNLMAPRMVSVFDANVTHNLVPMWQKAGIYEALYRSAGQTAAEVLPQLRAGLAAMKEDPDGFAALDPPNKWGCYETAVPWLEQLVEQCEENPEAIIEVSA